MPLLVLSILVIAWRPSSALTYTTATSAHFKITYPTSDRAYLAPIVRQAETLLEGIWADIGHTKLGLITVYFEPNFDRFSARMPRGYRALDWMAGIAFPRRSLVIIRSNSSGFAELKKTFLHELSHIVLLNAVSHRHLPHWFIEGFALYQAGEWSIERIKTFIDAAVTRSLHPLSKLDAHFPAQHRSVSLAYAQSAAFMHFLFRRYGGTTFQHLLRKLTTGTAFGEAMRSVYGKSVPQLEKQWHAELKTLGRSYLFLTPVFIWGALGLLFVAVWWKVVSKRRRALANIADSEREPEVVFLRPKP